MPSNADVRKGRHVVYAPQTQKNIGTSASATVDNIIIYDTFAHTDGVGPTDLQGEMMMTTITAHGFHFVVEFADLALEDRDFAENAALDALLDMDAAAVAALHADQGDALANLSNTISVALCEELGYAASGDVRHGLAAPGLMISPL